MARRVPKKVLAVFVVELADMINDTQISVSVTGKSIGVGIGTLIVTKTGALCTYSSID